MMSNSINNSIEIYFDNAATTKPTKRVVEVVANTMLNEYGNPSSAHIKGVESENVIIEARENFSSILGCREDELIFTSGGTESNNLAVSGVASRNRRNGEKIIISPIEHQSVLAQIERLQSYGYEVLFAPIDKNGVVEVDKLEQMIDDSVVLVSIMYVNNEIGIKQPIKEICKAVKRANKNTLVHSDIVQAFGKIKINLKLLGVDLASVSGHKFHSPKGVGLLYIKKGVMIEPIIKGSSQQYGLRAGTENVPSIAGMSEAAKQVYEDFDAKQKVYEMLKNHLVSELEKIEDVFFFVDNDVCVNHIVSFGIKNIKSEVMLHALEDKGIYVSNGAACSSKKKKKKGTLVAIGTESDKSETAIRVSFNSENTIEQIDYFVGELKKLIDMLKRYVRK